MCLRRRGAEGSRRGFRRAPPPLGAAGWRGSLGVRQPPSFTILLIVASVGSPPRVFAQRMRLLALSRAFERGLRY